MNPIAEEIASYYGIANFINALEHYGMPRRSGRYPWGSGENPYQHGNDFLGRVAELKKNGWTETAENIKKNSDSPPKNTGMKKRGLIMSVVYIWLSGLSLCSLTVKEQLLLAKKWGCPSQRFVLC